MKKRYENPRIEVIQIEPLTMLTVSGSLGGDAHEPAKSRYWDDEEY